MRELTNKELLQMADDLKVAEDQVTRTWRRLNNAQDNYRIEVARGLMHTAMLAIEEARSYLSEPR